MKDESAKHEFYCNAPCFSAYQSSVINANCSSAYNSLSLPLPEVNDDLEATLEQVVYLLKNSSNVQCGCICQETQTPFDETRKEQIFDEYFVDFSHLCNVLETPCLHKFNFLSLSSSLSDAKMKIIWSIHKKGWKYSIVESDPSSLLIGYIYQAEDGGFYFSDCRQALACVFVVDDDPLINACESSIFCELNSKTVTYLIALKSYSFVFDQFIADNVSSAVCVYLYFPTSSVVLLQKKEGHNVEKHSAMSLNKSRESSYNLKNVKYCYSSDKDDISEITESFQDKLSLSSSSTVTSTSISNTYICYEFKVVFKMWSFVKGELRFQKALVMLFQKRTLHTDGLHDVHAILTSSFCNDCDKSDELESQLSQLNLNQDDEFAILSFNTSSMKLCADLIPDHVYYMACPHELHPFSTKMTMHDYSEWAKTMKENSAFQKLSCLNIPKHTVVFHSPKCDFHNESLGKENLQLKTMTIPQITSKRFSKSSIVQAILVDKFFIEDTVSSDRSENCKKLTLCLVLKDELSSYSIRLYAPFYPDNLHGLLPGTVIHLFGCLCMCSHKNNLYLKTSSSFGMKIVKSGLASFVSDSNKVPQLLKYVKSHNSQSSFIHQSFLLRILSVRMFSVCCECLQEENTCNTKDNCIVYTEVNFEVDDGSTIASMCSSGEDARNLLKLTADEWKFFLHYVKKEEQLKFNINEKIETKTDSVSKVFHLLCSSPKLHRHIVFRCIPQWVAGEMNQLKLQYICRDVFELQMDNAMKIYTAFAAPGHATNIL